MRKTLLGVAVCAANLCFGDASNLLVTFSTPGPDRYADGSTVLDGERYALVYVRGSFGGIAADGRAVDADDAVVAVLSRAEKGRCPTTVFQVPSELAKTLTGGSYAVYLLDTRLAPAANGVARLAPADARTGLPTAIAKTTEVATKIVADAYAGTRATGVAAKEAAVATAVPADAPQPVVKSIRVEGAYVYITVAGTIPSLQYNVAGGVTPDRLTSVVGTPAQGAASVDEEITIVAPAQADGGFFRVQRN